ncbi:MAG: ATP-binding protein [Acidobacteriota bacterium]|nr:ATP-binding protein [Acidobacteriota bacterium]
MPLNSELELVIGSRFEDLELVDLVMDFACGYLAMAEPERAYVSLAVREATANAVGHGHQMDASKRVTISIRLDDELLTVTVRDSGGGFDVSALPNPLDPSNLLKSAGRGIFLMRQFMDQVSFRFPSAGGTVVEMSHRVTHGSVTPPGQSAH